MEEWAAHSFSLSKKNKEGTSEREYLEQVERQTGIKPKELIPPKEFPYLVSHIWSAFCVLSDSRTIGFNGPNPITYEQIKAWMDVTNTVLKPRDVEAVIRLDRIYLKEQYG